MTLYVSTATQGPIAHLLGAPHYSYHFAAQRFQDLLVRMGHPAQHLAMPEYYATPAALPGSANTGNLHLIFRSTAQIRLLKPAVNICCFAWEFPVLKADTLPGEHPFSNQRAMLALCDEIWVPSTYARTVLTDYGLAAQRIPAPVPLPDGGRRDRQQALRALGALDVAIPDINFAWPEAHQDQHATVMSLAAWLATHTKGRSRPTIFLSVLNPEDFRKNLDAMIRGFQSVRRVHPDAVLIIKALTSATRFELRQVAGGVLRNKLAPGTVLHDDGIAIFNAYLSDLDMTMLYSLADFYICTSLAEGQNLPLLEAMAHGTVAITTCNTAMADYIGPDNAFAISCQDVMNDNPHLAGTVALRPFAVALCQARSVYDALKAALACTGKRRAARAQAGVKTVAHLYSDQAIWPLVQARLLLHGAVTRA